MYNLNDIQSKFFSDKIITFRSSLNSTTPVLDSDLTGISKSKRYFNSGVHPLITLENIEWFLPLLSNYAISDYAVGTTYDNYNNTFSLNDVVTANSKYYISIASSNVGNAVGDTTYWKETTLMSLILKDKIRSAIEVVVSNLIVPNFIEENIYMYRVADNTDDLIENTDKLVGFRINPISSNHLLFLINQIGLHFESNETITFYLYNQNSLVTSFNLSATSKFFEWKDLSAEIEIASNKGAWYLFYDQSVLSGRAIGNNSIFTNYMFNYANITPFEMDSVSDLTDINTGNLVYDKNYGINLNFSVSYDLTSFIKQHLIQFAECIQQQFEYDIINVFCYNPNAKSDRSERIIDKDRLYLELKSYDGDTIIKRLRSSYKRLEATIEKLSYKDNAFARNEEDNFIIGSV